MTIDDPSGPIEPEEFDRPGELPDLTAPSEEPPHLAVSGETETDPDKDVYPNPGILPDGGYDL